MKMNLKVLSLFYSKKLTHYHNKLPYSTCILKSNPVFNIFHQNSSIQRLCKLQKEQNNYYLSSFSTNLLKRNHNSRNDVICSLVFKKLEAKYSHISETSVNFEKKKDTNHHEGSSLYSQHKKEISINKNAFDPNVDAYYHVEATHTLPHPIWSQEALNKIEVTHLAPEKLPDTLAFLCVKSMRSFFDVITGYAFGRIDEKTWLNRIVFLETVAGVPGMVGAFIRHLRSLRTMDRDYGWTHTLLEEAENERMHLMTAIVIRQPSNLMKFFVRVTQIIFTPAFAFGYFVSARFAHRFVAYLEEEAVKTYTKLTAEIDKGHLPLFENLPAPSVAKDYWALNDDAVFRDVVLALRADESHHRDVNHVFAELPKNHENPFPPGH